MLLKNNSETQLRESYLNPLFDLGSDGNTSLKNIYSPLYDKSVLARFMTGLYTEEASARAQMKSLGLSNYYNSFLKRELLDSGRIQDPKAALNILEIGCGVGTATFSLLNLFPNSQLCAAELSIPMLMVLKEHLDSSEDRNRCALMQLNAEELNFKNDSFDLVVGAAILHHLFEPHKAIEQSIKILKPGGIAIFFEPYEPGMAMVNLIYKMIFRDPRSLLMKRKFWHYLKYTIEAWDKICTLPKGDPYFRGIDDKWFFTRQYFQNIADSTNASKLIISSLSSSETPFRDMVREHIRGNGFADCVPSWIWSLVDTFEKSISPALKKDLATEAVVIFVK